MLQVSFVTKCGRTLFKTKMHAVASDIRVQGKDGVMGCAYAFVHEECHHCKEHCCPIGCHGNCY